MNDKDFSELAERAQLLADLTQHPGWEMLTELVTARVDARNRRLLDGQAETVEEYRAWAGWIQGAGAVLQLPAELAQQVERERNRRAEARQAA